MPLDEMTRRNLIFRWNLMRQRLNDCARCSAFSTRRSSNGEIGGGSFQPPNDRERIEARLNAVESSDQVLVRSASAVWTAFSATERLGGKAATGRATPRELRVLGDSMGRLPAVYARLSRYAPLSSRARGRPVPACSAIAAVVDGQSDLCEEICSSCWWIGRP